MSRLTRTGLVLAAIGMIPTGAWSEGRPVQCYFGNGEDGIKHGKDWAERVICRQNETLIDVLCPMIPEGRPPAFREMPCRLEEKDPRWGVRLHCALVVQSCFEARSISPAALSSKALR